MGPWKVVEKDENYSSSFSPFLYPSALPLPFLQED